MLTEVKIKSLYQNIENLLFIFIFFISFVISLIIFLSLSGYLLNLGQVEDVSILISINFFLIILLILISLNKIFKIFIEKKLKSKFRIQFTSLFIIISFIPTSLITIFSLVFFDQGVKNWFNDKISRVIDGSKEISESYFNEHKNSIKKDILFINNELSSEEVFFLLIEKDAQNF